MNLLGLVPAGIWFATVGAIIGSVWASLQDDDPFFRACVESFISVVFAAAVCENYLPLDRYWTCGAVSVMVGLITGRGLDVVKVIAPAALTQFVEALAAKFLGYKKDEPK